jgi:hypothetical protein
VSEATTAAPAGDDGLLPLAVRERQRRFLVVRGNAAWRRQGASLVVSCLLSAAFLAGGWAVQELGLPRPSRADEVAASAAGWMLRHQLVLSSFRLNGGRLIRARCLQHWFPTRDGATDRGTLLELSSGVTLAGIHPSELTVRRAPAPEPFPLRLAQLELAGCPSMLARQLAEPAQAGRPLHLRALGADLAVVVPTSRATLTIVVDRRTDEPLAISLESRQFRGSGWVRFVPVAGAMLKALKRLRIEATAVGSHRPNRPDRS